MFDFKNGVSSVFKEEAPPTYQRGLLSIFSANASGPVAKAGQEVDYTPVPGGMG